jgi:hypothetical protein
MGRNTCVHVMAETEMETVNIDCSSVDQSDRSQGKEKDVRWQDEWLGLLFALIFSS